MKSVRSIALTVDILPRVLQDLLSIDRDTIGERWNQSHFEFDAPGKWEVSKLLVNFDGRPVAFAIASLKERSIHVHRLAVDPVHRGEGLGTELLRQLAETAQSRGVEFMTLKVAEGNHLAAKLYQRLGFVATGRVQASIVLEISLKNLLKASSKPHERNS